MGISSSTSPSELDLHPEMLYNAVDEIASEYILGMDYKTFQMLNEKEYCDKLLELVSSIFSNKLSDLEIKYMFQRIQYGNHANESNLQEFQREKLYYHVNDSDKADIKMETFDVTLNNEHRLEPNVKQILCVRITKFYLIIAHLFASIMKTINPIYTYLDDDNKVVEVNIMKNDKVPLNKEIQLTYLNFCSERFHHLQKTTSGTNPSICKLNVSEVNHHEPTIYAFENLYLHDEDYVSSAGQFTKKSDMLQEELRQDLKSFYTAYTGNNVMPDSITKFSDIRLKDFNTVCDDEIVNTAESDDNLFLKYAQNLKDMMIATSKHQEGLLDELHIIFENDVINSDLIEDNIFKMVGHTRKKIINMYVDCERFYKQGIQMNNDIVEHLKQRNLKKQSSFFRKKIDGLMTNIKNKL
jgi:hypothetical protein